MADPEGKHGHVRRSRLAAGSSSLARCITTFLIVTLGTCAHAAPPAHAPAAPRGAKAPAPKPKASPEARLIEVYRALRAGDSRKALAEAESLSVDVPNFQLAQLVYGDLLLVRQGKAAGLAAAPAEMSASAAAQWSQLREEASLRLAALTEHPPANSVPRQFLDIPASTRHVMAVDASRARLYVFENGVHGMKLVADHYVSLGRFGTDKKEQGDQRTPLGAYFITSRLEGRQLKDFYGPGALPLNYPNEYDRRRGKTGGGIWLHGVPPQNFARTPQSTDGCVVLSNDDLLPLLRTVLPRRTPVVIAPKLEWVNPSSLDRERTTARTLVEQWRQARSGNNLQKLAAFYSPQFSSGTADLAAWTQQLAKEMNLARGRESELKELSILSWRDTGDVLIVTFGEVRKGERSGPMKRQYWGKEGGQWKIFFEGVIG
jgi:murein L,D-transpeptidase YafK